VCSDRFPQNQADVIVIDRNISVGMEGALFSEVKAALYGSSDAKVHGFIAGLGGKDVTYKDIEIICKKAMKGAAKQQEWYGVEA
jgi:pyruvate ferredoxin oxidoreductase alpha subunit